MQGRENKFLDLLTKKEWGDPEMKEHVKNRYMGRNTHLKYRNDNNLLIPQAEFPPLALGLINGNDAMTLTHKTVISFILSICLCGKS